MKYVVGGLGDFLQVVEEAQKEKKIGVVSHFIKSVEFWKELGVEVEDFRYFELDNFSKTISSLKDVGFLKRQLHPKFNNKRDVRFIVHKAEGKEIIGIHPVGSNFSNRFWFENGQPLKIISVEQVKKLIEPDKFYIIFGTNNELEEYKDLESKNVFFTWNSDIWTSFALVEKCSKVIAIDSAIKSYSVIKDIPTLVLLGDYVDVARDKHFIEPYVNEGIMKVVKFKEIGDKEINGVKQWMDNS